MRLWQIGFGRGAGPVRRTMLVTPPPRSRPKRLPKLADPARLRAGPEGDGGADRRERVAAGGAGWDGRRVEYRREGAGEGQAGDGLGRGCRDGRVRGQ